MRLRDRVLRMMGVKVSEARIVSTQMQIGQAIPTPANYEGYAKQGFSKNVMVYVCVEKIAKACAGIEWELYQKPRAGMSEEDMQELPDTHPLMQLINRPNPMQGTPAFIEAVVAYFLLTGNSYIEQNKGGGKLPLELWPMRPDKIKIIGGKNGYPGAYEFTASGSSRIFPVDPFNMSSDVLHMKTFNPLHDWYGMSPLQAAMMSVDSYNAGAQWNYSLLKNSANPSGVLQMEVSSANPRGDITEEQYARMKREFEESYQGAQNAGKPMLLEGGLKWSQMSLSPKDMDFLKSKEVSSLDIARAFGVPGEIIGLGKTIYNNYEEARLAFYEDTILPLMDFVKGELNRHLAPQFGDGLCLEYDKDDIEALQYKRVQKFNMVKDVTFLNQNEKRQAAGYAPVDGWDVFLINNQLVATPEDMQSTTSDASTPAPDANAADAGQCDNCDMPDCEGCDGTPPAKPKKPMPMDDEEDPDMMDMEKAAPLHEVKFFNLLNRNEKVSTWKKQNNYRARLIKSLSRDLQEDFAKLAADIGEAARSVSNPKFAELAMLRAIDDNSKYFKRTLEKHARYALEDFGNAILSQAKKEFGFSMRETKAQSKKFDQYVEAYIKRRTGEAITQIEGTTRKQVMNLVKKYTSAAIADSADAHYSFTDYADELQDEFEGLSRGRANTIARTEVGAATSRGSLEAAKALDIPNLQKEWVSAEDDRVRDGAHGGADHEKADGQIVDLDEKFTVPPDASMDCPLDPAGGADQVCNCRCVLVYKAGKTL